ncbi:MAG: ribonuclease P protein component [Thermodesulfobacteriota bacterium]|nr:ribonuclease P protein component [Thermodesulfobacteriota bacterium]
MLPKNCLLRKTGEFNQVYRRGQRLRGNGFALIYLPGDQPVSRLGLSVHRKVGNAVRRNRIKRFVRETFRLHREIFPQSSDIIFTVRPEFSLNGMHAIRAAVSGLTGFQGQS